MKKQIILVMSALALSSVSSNAQTAVPNKYSYSIRKTTTKPATIEGNAVHIVYGKIPVLETKLFVIANQKINFNGQAYYYNSGDFFLYNGGRYLLVLPPSGIEVFSLPKTKEQVSDNNFYYKGIFYKKTTSGYQVVNHIQGAVIYNLPEMVAVVTVGDEAYYEYLGVLYKKVFVEGEQGYEVIGEVLE